MGTRSTGRGTTGKAGENARGTREWRETWACQLERGTSSILLQFLIDKSIIADRADFEELIRLRVQLLGSILMLVCSRALNRAFRRRRSHLRTNERECMALGREEDVWVPLVSIA